MIRTVAITGASSGLGAALAVRYAKDRVNLVLLGRNAERLERVASECRDMGASAVECVTVDVRARAELTSRLNENLSQRPIDLLIVNAGVTGGTTPDGDPEPIVDSYEVFSVNVFGTINTIHAVLPAMQNRGSGHIVIVSSMAAYLPLPDSPSYCASKAAIMTYGLALRETSRPQGIDVSVVCPAYIHTPMSQRRLGPKPLLMTAEAASKLIYRGIANRKRTIIFPVRLGLVTRIIAQLPEWLLIRTLPSFRISPQRKI